jgi:hypothetical protein
MNSGWRGELGVSLSEKKEVAGLAELFERILLAAKPGQQRVVRQ